MSWFLLDVLYVVALFGALLYPFVLGAIGVVRWLRDRLNPAARRELPPIWKRKAGIPLLLFPIAIAIAIPNLLEGVTRGRSMQAMADLRGIATAAETFYVDNKAYPVAASMDELAKILEPRYMARLPRGDKWGQPYRYFVRNLQKDGPQEYVILCNGSDGLAERQDPWSYPQVATTDYARDIVYSNGEFIQYPEGRSR